METTASQQFGEAREMVSVETIGEIWRARRVQGKSIRSVAKSMGMSRNTVRKVLRSGESAPEYRRPDQPHPKLGDFIPELERKLEANKEKKRRDRPSMKRIWGQLADPGCDASYNAVCRYATAWKRRHGAGVSGAHFPLVFDPAEAIKPDLEGHAGDLPLIFLSRTTVALDQMSAEELDALKSEAFRFSGVGALER